MIMKLQSNRSLQQFFHLIYASLDGGITTHLLSVKLKRALHQFSATYEDAN